MLLTSAHREPGGSVGDILRAARTWQPSVPPLLSDSVPGYLDTRVRSGGSDFIPDSSVKEGCSKAKL